jgi:hypothetical protein
MFSASNMWETGKPETVCKLLGFYGIKVGGSWSFIKKKTQKSDSVNFKFEKVLKKCDHCSIDGASFRLKT